MLSESMLKYEYVPVAQKDSAFASEAEDSVFESHQELLLFLCLAT